VGLPVGAPVAVGVPVVPGVVVVGAAVVVGSVVAGEGQATATASISISTIAKISFPKETLVFFMFVPPNLRQIKLKDVLFPGIGTHILLVLCLITAYF
jgi:hypothetical protein